METESNMGTAPSHGSIMNYIAIPPCWTIYTRNQGDNRIHNTKILNKLETTKISWFFYKIMSFVAREHLTTNWAKDFLC